MNLRFKSVLKTAALAIAILLPLHGHAADIDVVKAFYSDLLSNPKGDDLGERVRRVVTEDWESIPTPRGGKGAEGFAKSLAGFGAVLPDLNWEPQEILQDGNRFIVRSKATGTPAKKFFGVEPNGKSFEIMSI
ncbi:MAG: ester cyclase, partial [Pseudomonadota bacterium]